MMCTTVLHGGVCHRTSTPHKSGIKMKEKKKNCFARSQLISLCHNDLPTTECVLCTSECASVNVICMFRAGLTVMSV